LGVAIAIVSVMASPGCKSIDRIGAPVDRTTRATVAIADVLACGELRLTQEFKNGSYARVGEYLFFFTVLDDDAGQQELARIRALAQRRVAVALREIEDPNGRWTTFLECSRVSIWNEADVHSLFVRAIELNARCDLRAALQGWRNGSWRSYIDEVWHAPEAVVFARLDALAQEVEREQVLKDLIEWWVMDSNPNHKRADPVNLERFGLLGTCSDARYFAMLVVEELLKLPAGMLRLLWFSDDAARKLWRVVELAV